MAKQKKFNDAALIKERIHFDPYADARAKHELLPTVQIPATFWKGLQPVLQTFPDKPNAALPKADVLIITWTTAETQALSTVFTSNHDFMGFWHRYNNGFASIKKNIPPGTIKEKANKEGLGMGTLGFYTIVEVNGKTVILFKSELHPADDGDKLPIINLVKQINKQADPDLLITTGTAGANGSYLEPGDAVIVEKARFYLLKPKSYPLFTGITDSENLTNTVSVKNTYINYCNANVTGLIEPVLTDIAAKHGFAKIKRTPKIFYNDVPGNNNVYAAVSSNGFTMDDKAHTDGLQKLGIFNEMNDAFVAFALQGIAMPPKWLSIRNISEPQAPNLAKTTKTKWQDMYNAYGLYTTYNSAFACWSVIV